MKTKIPVLVLLSMLGTLFATSQSSYTYYFGNTLQGTAGAPALHPACTENYSSHDFSDIGAGTRSVFSVSDDCGVAFMDSFDFLKSGSYSIAMYAELDQTNGYKKLVDFKNRQDDDGLYNLDEDLVFYNITNFAVNTLFTDTGYTRIVITRDSATQIVSLYAAGQSVYSFQDSTGLAVYDSNKILYFLTDDSIVTGESTTGQIAALRIYNYALDSATAKNLFLIGGPSGIPLVENSVSLATLYPNPTSSRLYIKLNNNLDNAVVEIYNIQGALMQQNRVSSSDNISLVNLASGMYVVKIYSGNQVMFSKIAKE